MIYAVEEGGGLYQSRDGAATWQNWLPIDGPCGSTYCPSMWARGPESWSWPRRAAFISAPRREPHWQLLPVPAEVGQPVDAFFDAGNARVMYAVGTRGVACSRDFGDEYLGQSWQSLTSELPALDRPQFVVCPGDPGRIYARSGSRLFTRTLDQEGWQRCADMGVGEYGELYPWLAVDRGQSGPRVRGSPTSIRLTGPAFAAAAQPGRGADLEQHARVPLPSNPGQRPGGHPVGGRAGRIAAADDRSEQCAGALCERREKGARVSTDGGATWRRLVRGHADPRRAIPHSAEHGDGVYAGTPGGLYVSRDRGANWTDANLWLQFTKNTRRELGGAAFIDAYWRARYFGFIDEAAAIAPIDRP